MGKKSYATNAILYLMRWQTNAFLMCEGKSIDQFSAPRLPALNLSSGYDDIRWLARDFVTERVNLSNSSNNPIVIQSANSYSTLMAVLNLGVRIAAPGSIVWTNGNDFKAINRLGQPFGGSIIKVDNDRIQSIKYNIPNSNHPDLWAYAEYNYTNESLPSFVPSHITHYFVDASRGMTRGGLADYDIFSLKIGSEPLPMEAFDPMKIVTTNNIISSLMEVRYTNNQAYQMIEGKPKYIEPISRQEANHTPLYLFYIVLVNVVLIGIYYLKNKQRIKNL